MTGARLGRGVWSPALPPENMDARLPLDFFHRPTLEVARDLVGQYMFSMHGGVVTGGRIVEAEAYCGPEDLGAHTSGGKRTARTEAMHGPKGRAYIYLIYGMYWCVNAVCGPMDKPQACLIRALEPVTGLDVMRERILAARKRPGGPLRDEDLCKGPGKLCRALGLDGSHYGADLQGDRLFLLPGELRKGERVATSPRIGIDYAAEFKDVPWRFFLAGNRCVSGPAKFNRFQE